MKKQLLSTIETLKVNAKQVESEKRRSRKWIRNDYIVYMSKKTNSTTVLIFLKN